MQETNDIVKSVYSLIDNDRIEEAEEQLEYLNTNELTQLFNYLTSVCPNNKLMRTIEKEIAVRTFSIMPEEYAQEDEYVFYE